MRELFIRNLWERVAGVAESENIIESLYKSEWSPTFEAYMRNRLVMGAMRYGRLKPGSKPKFDRILEIEKRIEKYKETGNQEFLVDVANFAMCEFIEPSMEWACFNPVDDGEHAREYGP